MNLKNTIAALSALALAVCSVSCEKKEEVTASLPEMTEKGISELISPAEDSKEYSLGEYYFSPNGTILYFGDDSIPNELMLALESYFLTLQNEDFEGYKNSLYPDYAERYDKYLREQYSGTMEGSDEYTLENSFEMQCANLRNMLIDKITYESETEQELSGNYKITRIRAERPVFAEGETEESYIESFFSYLNETLDVDYQKIVTDDTDDIECLTFFVIVEGEDGQEHKIVNEMNIFFVLKDGKYYTFG